jgi:hypothetical protein
MALLSGSFRSERICPNESCLTPSPLPQLDFFELSYATWDNRNFFLALFFEGETEEKNGDQNIN